ncbi:MAG: hypothetical protein D6729_06355 [Deltaproteobacteria bacterium]|nr:MAG: hypothetical protein D6729_06355 [Deltaproteobacteria bacterium]
MENTVPWYPAALRTTQVPERVLSDTLRFAAGRIFAAGKEQIYAIDPKTGEITDRLCIAELQCGDGDDTDYLAHRWDPWTEGSHVWIDPIGPRLVFLDAVGSQIANDLWVKVWDLDALPGDGSLSDAASRFAVPKTRVNTWLLGTWVDGGHLVVYARDTGSGETMVPFLDAYDLGTGDRVARVSLSYEGDPTDPAHIDHILFARMRLVWPRAVWVDSSGQRLVAWNLETGTLEWTAPEQVAGGRFTDVEQIVASKHGVFTFYGDTSGDPSVIVRYAWDGTREGFCPDLRHGVDFVHWASFSLDGALMAAVGSSGITRVRRDSCAVDHRSWSALADGPVSEAANENIEPQRSAFAGETALLGFTRPGDPAQTYVAVWPREAQDPVAVLGPVPEADPGQKRHFIVAGHNVVLAANAPDAGGTTLHLFGDATAPVLGDAQITSEDQLVFEASDDGGPLYAVGLLYRPAKGGAVEWVAATPHGGTFEVDVRSKPGGGAWLVRPLAVDLGGNVQVGKSYRLEIR